MAAASATPATNPVAGGELDGGATPSSATTEVSDAGSVEADLRSLEALLPDNPRFDTDGTPVTFEAMRDRFSRGRALRGDPLAPSLDQRALVGMWNLFEPCDPAPSDAAQEAAPPAPAPLPLAEPTIIWDGDIDVPKVYTWAQLQGVPHLTAATRRSIWLRHGGDESVLPPVTAATGSDQEVAPPSRFPSPAPPSIASLAPAPPAEPAPAEQTTRMDSLEEAQLGAVLAASALPADSGHPRAPSALGSPTQRIRSLNIPQRNISAIMDKFPPFGSLPDHTMGTFPFQAPPQERRDRSGPATPRAGTGPAAAAQPGGQGPAEAVPNPFPGQAPGVPVFGYKDWAVKRDCDFHDAVNTDQWPHDDLVAMRWLEGWEPYRNLHRAQVWIFPRPSSTTTAIVSQYLNRLYGEERAQSAMSGGGSLGDPRFQLRIRWDLLLATFALDPNRQLAYPDDEPLSVVATPPQLHPEMQAFLVAIEAAVWDNDVRSFENFPTFGFAVGLPVRDQQLTDHGMVTWAAPSRPRLGFPPSLFCPLGVRNNWNAIESLGYGGRLPRVAILPVRTRRTSALTAGTASASRTGRPRPLVSGTQTPPLVSLAQRSSCPPASGPTASASSGRRWRPIASPTRSLRRQAPRARVPPCRPPPPRRPWAPSSGRRDLRTDRRMGPQGSEALLRAMGAAMPAADPPRAGPSAS